MNIENYDKENNSSNDLDETIISESLLLSLYRSKLLNKSNNHEKK